MKKLTIAVFLFCAALSASANRLSNNARIYLLTCQPGAEVYATFGHSALYVKDAEMGIDAVFNYGIFDFDEESFLYKFVKGDTYYILGVNDIESFLWSYERRRCGVLAQELNLTQGEKERLFAALYDNAQPENRRYLYNFFYDNCATRIRDIVAENVDGEYLQDNKIAPYTYRELIEQYTKNTWLKFGIDVLVGAPADTLTNAYDAIMFLPFYLSDNYANIQVARNEYQPSLVAANEIFIPDFPREAPRRNAPLITMLIVLLIAMLVSGYEIRSKRQTLWFDFTLFALAGLVGIVLTFVQFFSIHPAVFPNYNILWLHPLQLLFAILLPVKSLRSTLHRYHYFNIIMALAAAFLGSTLQVFHPAFYPLLGAMVLRGILWIKINRKNESAFAGKRKRSC